MQSFYSLLCSAVVLIGLSSQSAVAEDNCDAPVDMVILSIVQDVERYQEYRFSLIEKGTIEAFGGRVISLATRLVVDPEMMEGEWPEDRHSFVVRWPCKAAAYKFWNSDVYQKEHLPLRVGAGQFNIALFPALPE